MSPNPPAAASNRRRNRRLVLACMVSLLVSMIVLAQRVVAAGPLRFDDAYMFIRYARHFLDGLGHAWNPDGIQTYGNTSLLHFFIVLALRASLPFRDGTILRTASMGAGLSAIVLLAVAAARVTPKHVLPRAGWLWAALLFPYLLWRPEGLYHLLSGMDTSLSLFCNTLLILAALHWSRRPGRAATAFLLAAAFLAFQARPDNLIAAVLFPPALLFLVERRWDCRRQAAAYLTILGLLLAADALLKWRLLNDPLPLSFFAKQHTHYTDYLGAWKWNPVWYLLQILQVCLPFIALAVLLAGRREAGLLTAFALPAFLTWGWYFTALQIMGFQARFYFPFVPYLILGGIAAAAQRIEDARQGRALPRRSLVPRLLAVLAFGWLVSIGPRRAAARAYARHFLPPQRAPRAQAGALTHTPPPLGWRRAILAMAGVARNLPPGTRAAMTEYGYIGAMAPKRFILDPLGLHDRWTAHHGFSAERFFADPPDLIWLPHPDYAGLRRAIMKNPVFQEAYDYYPGLFDYGIALRRNASEAGKIRKAVADQVRKEYSGKRLENYKKGSADSPEAASGF